MQFIHEMDCMLYCLFIFLHEKQHNAAIFFFFCYIWLYHLLHVIKAGFKNTTSEEACECDIFIS